MMTDGQLAAFVQESWRIEGYDDPDKYDLDRFCTVHWEFLQLQVPILDAITDAAMQFTKGRGILRARRGLDVQVGHHVPLRGGPLVVERLDNLLRMIAVNDMDPYWAHNEYETIHPFMDGNGRTGRMLWAWHMLRDGQDGYWPERGFLHTWYYQSLQYGRTT